MPVRSHPARSRARSSRRRVRPPPSTPTANGSSATIDDRRQRIDPEGRHPPRDRDPPAQSAHVLARATRVRPDGLRARPRAHPPLLRERGLFQGPGRLAAQRQTQTERSEILDLVVTIEEGPRAFVTSIEIDPPERHDAAAGDDDQAATKGEPKWALAVGDPFREVDYQLLEAQLRAAAARSRPRLGHDEADRPGDPRSRGRGDPLRDRRRGPRPASAPSRSRVSRRSIPPSSNASSPSRPAIASRSPASRSRAGASSSSISSRRSSSIGRPIPRTPEEAPISIVLREKKPRELRIGVGYSTEERARAHIRWQHRNWFGGGRRLVVSGRYSNLDPRRRALLRPAPSGQPGQPRPLRVRALPAGRAQLHAQLDPGRARLRAQLHAEAGPDDRPAGRDRGGAGRRGGGRRPGSAVCATRAC